MKTKNHFLPTLLALIALTPLFTTTSALAKNAGLDLTNFRIGQISVFQKGGSTFSGILTWNPGINFTDMFGIRASIGATYLKAKSTDKFIALEYALLGTLTCGDFGTIEVGGGFQNWLENGGNRKLLEAGFVMPLKEHFLIFDQIFAGYAAFLVPGNLTHEIRVGVGFF